MATNPSQFREGISVTLIGDKRLKKGFDQLPLKVQKSFLRQSLRYAAKLVQKRAKQLVPVGRTGVLKRSIRVHAPYRSRKNKNLVRIVISTGDKRGNLFKGKAYYGGIIEFGAPNYEINRKGGKKGTGVKAPRAAQPFMRPAAVQMKGPVIQVFRLRLKTLLAVAFGK